MIFQEMKLGTSVIPHFHVILPGPSISQGSSGDGEALKDDGSIEGQWRGAAYA